MYTYTFTCRDNGGKSQAIRISAADRYEAEKLGFRKARAKAKGDIISWDCRLNIVQRDGTVIPGRW